MSTQNAQPENVAAFDPLRAYRAFLTIPLNIEQIENIVKLTLLIRVLKSGVRWIRSNQPSYWERRVRTSETRRLVYWGTNSETGELRVGASIWS